MTGGVRDMRSVGWDKGRGRLLCRVRKMRKVEKRCGSGRGGGLPLVVNKREKGFERDRDRSFHNGVCLEEVVGI